MNIEDSRKAVAEHPVIATLKQFDTFMKPQILTLFVARICFETAYNLKTSNKQSKSQHSVGQQIEKLCNEGYTCLTTNFQDADLNTSIYLLLKNDEVKKAISFALQKAY